MTDYLKTADVWTVLDLIAVEFKSDATSVQCFDLRLVQRAIELTDEWRRRRLAPAAGDVSKGPLLLAIINAIGDVSKTEAWAGICNNWPQIVREMSDDPKLTAPVSDDDLVMRFRNLFAELWPVIPDEADATVREKKSRVVTMMLRATMQELVGHIGPNTKAVTYVIGKEAEQAILEKRESLTADAPKPH